MANTNERKFVALQPTIFNAGTTRELTGYTTDQAKEMVWQAFTYWMYGQTMAMDDEGKIIIYQDDVIRFVEGAIRTKVWD